MNDRQIDELITTAAPITDDAITAIDLSGLDAELKEQIMSTPVLMPVDSPPAEPEPQPQRTIWRVAAAVAVAAAVIVGIVMMPFGSTRDAAWAAEALAVARSSARLLVDLPGWEITRAHTFTVEEGEMTFGDGSSELDLHWRPAADHADYLEDREHSAESVRRVSVNGISATQFRYLGSNDYTTLWLDSGHSYEARGVFADRAAYEKVIAALTPTDIDGWLSAMPESVVKPDARLAVLQEMIADMPLPPGFDLDALAASTDVSDRYQLGAAASGAIACGWIGQWLDARRAGDATAEAEALDAMQTSRTWSILLEMQNEGAYPQVLWLHVDAMEADDDVPEPISVTLYRQALGC